MVCNRVGKLPVPPGRPGACVGVNKWDSTADYLSETGPGSLGSGHEKVVFEQSEYPGL